MLIKIEPPLLGQHFGQGDKNIYRLIISTRLEGRTLYPISEWPAHVYVARILDPGIMDTGCFSKDQVELIAWATIFRTFGEALDHAKRIDKDAVV